MISKDQIKDWLRETGRTRQWLADACHVKPGTVNNWLSTSIDMPAKALRIIDALMRADREATSPAPPPPPTYLTLRITVEEFEEWSKIALAAGMTITEWIVSVIRQACADSANYPAATPGHAEQPLPTRKGA